ncbi:MAG: hypothetical protein ACRDX8_06140 [Acidimicrobiales bacterium]
MRFAVDIVRDPTGHYEGTLEWGARVRPLAFSGLLELLSLIEREVGTPAMPDRGLPGPERGGLSALRASGTQRPGSPTDPGGSRQPDQPDQPDQAVTGQP